MVVEPLTSEHNNRWCNKLLAWTTVTNVTPTVVNVVKTAADLSLGSLPW
jgi:hypothetical protein